MWMVRAGRGGVYASEFIDQAYVGIGWTALGDPTGVTDKTVLIAAAASAYPDATEQSRFVSASIVWRFVNDIKVGDAVATYDPATRTYHIGKIVGHATWRDDSEDARSTQRAVTWTGQILRDEVSQTSLNTLGAILTLFLLQPAVANELRRLAEGKGATPSPINVGDQSPAAEPIDLFARVEDEAIERIKDRIVRFTWEQMQDLVAAVLRAMGYRTSVAARGPDRGRDILATPDGLGFKPPRIIVEVKHRPGERMGAPDVRAMPVGRQADDRGLFVSTGGFTREAYYEAEHGKVPITLMTLEDLTRTIIDVYSQFDDAGRALLPLRPFYWPVG